MSSHHSGQKWLLAVPALIGAAEMVHWYGDGLKLGTPLGLAVGLGLALLGVQGFEKWRFEYRVAAQRGFRAWQHNQWVFAFLVYYPSLDVLAPLALGRWLGLLPPGFGLAWGPWVWLGGLLLGPMAFILLKPFEAPHRLREVSLAAPPGRGPLKILFLSDLHLGNLFPSSRFDWVLDLVRRKGPDLVLLGGDLVDHDLDQLELHQGAIRSLAQAAPVYAALGNHDFLAGVRRFEALLEAWGVRLLRDEAVELPGRWPLVGLGDLDFEGVRADSLAQLEQPNALVLSHHPDLFKRLDQGAQEKVWLGFSGHTHGGQIVLPLIGALLHPADRRFQPGLNRLPGLPPVVVSPGLGYTLIPLRFGCPPEAIWVEIA